MYSIEQVSLLTGVSRDRIRKWETRHGLVTPSRTCGRHRRYSANDLKTLSVARQLIHLGASIGTLARLTMGARIALLAELSDGEPVALGRPEVAFLMTALRGQRFEIAGSCLHMVINALPPLEFIESVIGPLCAEIGRAWASGELSVGQEHAISAIILRRLQVALDSPSADQGRGAKLLVTSPSNELHEIGAMGIAYLTDRAGTATAYAGPNMPPLEACKLAKSLRVRAVALSVVNDIEDDSLDTYLSAMSHNLPPDCEIWLGGRGLRGWNSENSSLRASVFQDLAAFELSARNLDPLSLQKSAVPD